MIPEDVAHMRDEMISAGLSDQDALVLAWRFYKRMKAKYETKNPPSTVMKW